jgi:glucuronate isomerase
VLAEDFVIGRCWPEERAVELGRQVLRGNVETIFGVSGY